MNDASLSCREEQRREDVRAASLFGLDYVEVANQQQTTLNVFFLGKAPRTIELANVVLTGGRRIRDVQIRTVRVMREADQTLDDYLEVTVNKAGDFSMYTISLVNAVDGQPTGRRGHGISLGFRGRAIHRNALRRWRDATDYGRERERASGRQALRRAGVGPGAAH